MYDVVRPSYLTGLLLISAVCGLVDAACFLALGGVFAEIMTGNILLLAFRVGSGKPVDHVTILRYIEALVAFGVGAFVAGRAVRGDRPLRDRRIVFGIEWALVAGAPIVVFATDAGRTGTGRDVAVAALAGAMGMQNAVLRRHGVTDVATNLMTLTYAGLIADSSLAGGRNPHWGRRAGSIVVFFVSATVGAFLLRYGAGWTLLVATVCLGAATLILATTARVEGPAADDGRAIDLA